MPPRTTELKKPQRIRQGVRASLQLSLVVSTVLGVFLLLCGRQMAGLFLAEPSAEILTVVQRFLPITAVPYPGRCDAGVSAGAPGR